jgi:hypothetical protein
MRVTSLSTAAIMVCGLQITTGCGNAARSQNKGLATDSQSSDVSQTQNQRDLTPFPTVQNQPQVLGELHFVHELGKSIGDETEKAQVTVIWQPIAQNRNYRQYMGGIQGEKLTVGFWPVDIESEGCQESRDLEYSMPVNIFYAASEGDGFILDKLCAGKTGETLVHDRSFNLIMDVRLAGVSDDSCSNKLKDRSYRSATFTVRSYVTCQ